MDVHSFEGRLGEGEVLVAAHHPVEGGPPRAGVIASGTVTSTTWAPPSFVSSAGVVVIGL